MYKRYVDDILIIYDQTKTDETTIHSTINNTDENRIQNDNRRETYHKLP